MSPLNYVFISKDSNSHDYQGFRQERLGGGGGGRVPYPHGIHTQASKSIQVKI